MSSASGTALSRGERSLGALWGVILEIARHELAVTWRTRRALWVSGLYLFSAAVGGFAYVLAVRVIEKQALAALEASGMGPAAAAAALSLAGQHAYAQFVAFFAGVDAASIAPAIRDSIVLPALLWGSLAFLPLVVVLTSFDQIAGELATRSLLYSVVRVPRHAVLLGKLLGQAIVLAVLTLAASVTLVGIASALLESLSVSAVIWGLVRVVVLLVPFGFCYLGISAFASASVRQPTLALFGALAIMLGLRLAGWLENIPQSSAWAPLRWLSYLSPARYHAGLWEAGLWRPLASVLAYVLIGAAFTALAAVELRERDL